MNRNVALIKITYYKNIYNCLWSMATVIGFFMPFFEEV